MAQIQEIDRQMVRLQEQHGVPTVDHKSAPVTVSAAPGMKPRRRQTERGALKEKILRALRAAGRRGISVAELSRKLAVPNANLYVWFHTTGRNVPGLKKIGTARYRLG